jgi:hypothetical protein
MKFSLNELIALILVLEFITVKDLLISAMHNFTEQSSVRS